MAFNGRKGLFRALRDSSRFAKSDRAYTFVWDPVRVPAKYPNKRYYKGPNKALIVGSKGLGNTIGVGLFAFQWAHPTSHRTILHPRASARPSIKARSDQSRRHCYSIREYGCRSRSSPRCCTDARLRLRHGPASLCDDRHKSVSLDCWQTRHVAHPSNGQTHLPDPLSKAS